MTVKRVIDIHCPEENVPELLCSGGGQMELSLSLDIPAAVRNGGRESLLKRYRKFIDFWNESVAELVRPEAFFSIVPPGELDAALKHSAETRTASRDIPQDEAVCVDVLWTIGSGLEKESFRFFKEGQSMNGVFIDIAGNTLLNRMHAAIQRRVREAAEGRFSGKVILELSPGIGPDEAGSAEDGPKNGSRKSMRSLFFIGKGSEKLLKTIRRCRECKGPDCLYAQLGGCHYGSG